MRLDLVLKTSGIIKRRTVAKDLSQTGHILINGRVGKPSSDVKDGDQLIMNFGTKTIKAIVVISNKGKKEIASFKQDENA